MYLIVLVCNRFLVLDHKVVPYILFSTQFNLLLIIRLLRLLLYWGSRLILLHENGFKMKLLCFKFKLMVVWALKPLVLLLIPNSPIFQLIVLIIGGFSGRYCLILVVCVVSWQDLWAVLLLIQYNCIGKLFMIFQFLLNTNFLFLLATFFNHITLPPLLLPQGAL